ncbi:LytTR family DNA-binding domain-containing protein [Aliikangiella sp. G2MR2-5]|uniref:LytR/AlgR family response regulator transcription factor n=1 Tax=Aliikangiella sp. G2MR2-5 TaxID=2788943 RepID=UPI0018AC7A7B|nr:response regulator transcription factor [Aliikangiella sp. G2MR2-5]
MMSSLNSQTNKIKAIIVDDESLARKTIRFSLKQYANWEVCDEYSQGEQALEGITVYQPDVVFLDIKMPGIDGITLCNKLQKFNKVPLIIFVTAFDNHAIEAFELCALDYLLKPFDDERFAKAIKKAEELLAITNPQTNQLNQLEQVTKNENAKLDKLIVRSVGKIQLIDVEKINWISTAGNYVELHLDDQNILHRVSLSFLQKHLSADIFLRVHRTALVRVSLVSEFLTLAEGNYAIVLINGDKVNVSQTYKDILMKKLGIE